MERLTKRDEKGRAYFDDDGILIRGANGAFHNKKDMTGQFIHQRFVALDKTIDRLADYEDTLLEPEEIEEAKDRVDTKFMLWVTKAWELPEGRLHEILQAEKDGRLVVLPPCKAGERIFKIVDMQSHSAYKDFVTDAEVLPFGVPIKSIIGGAIIIPIEDFGKTVFLTREEAEAALKKREEADNGPN